MSKGFVKLFREVNRHPKRSNPVWFSLFMYFVTEASRREHKVLFNDVYVKLVEGQLVSSYRDLGELIGCDKQKIMRVVRGMIEDGEISVEKSNKFTVFTVLNWSKYQTSHNKSDTQNDTQNDTQGDTQKTSTSPCLEKSECDTQSDTQKNMQVGTLLYKQERSYKNKRQEKDQEHGHFSKTKKCPVVKSDLTVNKIIQYKNIEGVVCQPGFETVEKRFDYVWDMSRIKIGKQQAFVSFVDSVNSPKDYLDLQNAISNHNFYKDKEGYKHLEGRTLFKTWKTYLEKDFVLSLESMKVEYEEAPFQ